MRHTLIRKSLAGVMGLFIASSSLVAVAATAAHAEGTGYVKICKAAFPTVGNMSATPTFTFKISNVSGTTTVTAGTCSGVISVPAGTQTVTETLAPWFSVASITELPGQSYLTSTNLGTGAATISVANSTSVDVVTYTNDPVTGYVEVCKQATSGSGLTGLYSFNIAGADSFSATGSASAVAGATNCSAPIIVPAGQVTVTEAGTNLYVTGITATTNGVGATDIVGSANTVSGTVTVKVAASKDSSTQTDVTYTNNVVSLEVCKTWDPGKNDVTAPSTGFPFTETATGPAGPNTAPGPFSVAAGQCSPATQYRPGTAVTITEGIVPGSKVETISTDGNAESIVVGTLSVTSRTITVLVGTPVTSSLTSPTNDAIVTFTNTPADPGTLKICKFAGTVAPVGTTFTFTVSGAPGTTTVGLGQCGFVLGSNGLPMQFPFNSTQLITESGSAGNAASAISVSPTYVTENVGGTPTLTSETVLSGTPSLGSLGTASSVSAVIGEDTLTEAMFTDTDPPAPSSSPVTVSIPGGSNLGTTTASTPAVAQSVAGSASVTSSATAVASANPVAVAASAKLSPAARNALLKHDRALLKVVNARIAAELVKLHHVHGAAHRAALRLLRALRSHQHALKVAISRL